MQQDRGDIIVWPTRKQVMAPGLSCFRPLLDKVGLPDFFDGVAGTLAGATGLEHMHFFFVEDARPQAIASVSVDGSRIADSQFQDYLKRSYWHIDPIMKRAEGLAQEAPTLFRSATAATTSTDLRRLFEAQGFAERLMVCARQGATRVGLTAVRLGKDRFFDAEQVDFLAQACDVVIPLLLKHIGLCRQRDGLVSALSSLPLIEQTLADGRIHFPFRERQTCARLLYGLSATTIAAQLGVSEGTILSYRKRIYQRLFINSHRELILWYLGQHLAVRDPMTTAA